MSIPKHHDEKRAHGQQYRHLHAICVNHEQRQQTNRYYGDGCNDLKGAAFIHGLCSLAFMVLQSGLFTRILRWGVIGYFFELVSEKADGLTAGTVMSEETGRQGKPLLNDEQAGHEDIPASVATLGRRKLLLGGGAVAASAVVSIRPALAQTAASVLNCQIPVPDPGRAGRHIAADGRVVAPGTDGAFPGAGRAFTGEEIKAALRGGRTLPGTSHEQSRAYLNYIRRLQRGQSGFTCYASLQMPR